MNRPVTVAIPFAREPIEFVRAALNSLLAQDHTNWVGVLLDDSPAGSPAVAQLVASYGDARLRYTRHEGTHGIGNAWNACMDHAQTELFCMLHTDDELEPSYLSGMLALADAYPQADCYFCAVAIIDENGKPCFSLPDAIKEVIAPKAEPMRLEDRSGVARLTVGDFILAPTIVYAKSKIGGRRFSPRHSMVLDLRFLLELLLDGGSIVGTHRRLYRYRRHATQQTSQLSASGKRFAEELEVFREIEHEAKARGWSFVRLLAIARPIFRLNAVYQLLRDLRARRTRAAANKLRYVFG